MPVKTADQAFKAWQAAMQSPQTAANYKAGIAAVQQSPMAAAAAPDAQQRYAANTAAAVSSGRMAAKLNSVSMDTWKQQSATVGGPRLASGAQKGATKAAAAFQKLQGVWQQQQDAVRNMPKGGLANAQARAAAAIAIAMQAAGTA